MEQYTVGQNIFGGQLVVATVDAQNLILSVVVPSNKDQTGQPLTITYSAGQTVAGIEQISGLSASGGSVPQT